MKRSRSVVLLTPLVLAACSEEPPPVRYSSYVECEAQAKPEHVCRTYRTSFITYYVPYYSPGYYSALPSYRSGGGSVAFVPPIVPPRPAPAITRAPINMPPSTSVPSVPMTASRAFTAPIARGGFGGIGAAVGTGGG